MGGRGTQSGVKPGVLYNATGTSRAMRVEGQNPTMLGVTKEVPVKYRTAGGEDARTYFENGSYAKSYTPEKFAQDSRIVQQYSGIDFERSAYSYTVDAQQAGYFQAIKRWRKQIDYNKRNR